MQLFIRTLDGSHLAVQLREQDTVEHLQQALEARMAVPAEEQLLVHGGRALQGSAPLASLGTHATVQLLLRLRGGKGGFGALLRGQGRDGKITDNFDACRDLSGRRIKQVEAEKKLREWQATAKEREAQKAAEKEAREKARREERERMQEIIVDQVRQEQRKALDHVHDAVQSAVAEGLAHGSNGTASTSAPTADSPSTGEAAAVPAKRKHPAAPAAGEAGPSSKRPRKAAMLALLEGSDDEEDSSDEEDGST